MLRHFAKYSYCGFMLVMLVLVVGSKSVLAVTPTPAVTPIVSNPVKIAFAARDQGKRNIYVANADGSNIHALTNTTDAGWPMWSPDGKHIIFSAIASSGWGIFVIDTNGSNQQILSSDGMFPVWSPDGVHIAFISIRDGQPRPYIMNSNGSDQRQLADVDVQVEAPKWSPNSKSIAFVSTQEQIYTVGADGSTIRYLADYSNDPMWSPDGKKIAFSAYREGGIWYIYVMNVDGSGQYNFTSNYSSDARWPMWSPDGKYLAFVTTTGSTPEINVITTEDSSQKWSIIAHDPIQSRPVWSPDGERIAFITSCGGKPSIYLVDSNGASPQCLMLGGIPSGDLVWSPEEIF